MIRILKILLYGVGAGIVAFALLLVVFSLTGSILRSVGMSYNIASYITNGLAFLAAAAIPLPLLLWKHSFFRLTLIECAIVSVIAIGVFITALMYFLKLVNSIG